MSAPARRRPGGDSAIKLAVEVEDVKTTGTAAPAAASVAPAPAAAEVVPVEVKERPAKAAPVKRAPASSAVKAKKAVTLQLSVDGKSRAETAVLRSAGYEGGYSSLSAFVEGAIERELERTAKLFNNGEPWQANAGTFRQGRPFGG